MRRSLRLWSVVFTLVLLAAACAPPNPTPGEPPAPDPYLEVDPDANTFEFATKLSGLNQPVNAAFAPDGRVFVAEMPGVIKTFDSIDDPTPTVTADLTAAVRKTGEHGLVGLTVDKAYPTRPFIYALYAWDSTGLWGDGCAANYQINGCVTGGRLVKITVDGSGVMTGSPETLVEDRWCFQFNAHSVGSVEMLSDGSLVLTAGEGANYTGVDYGQHGGQQLNPPVADLTPANPCGDPPGGEGVPGDPATSQGGALRSQDLLTDGDPLVWDGSLVRIHPDTGEPMPDNPLVGKGTTDDDAVIAHGFRNPNRITIQPGTDRVFVGNVGQGYAEEIEAVDIGSDTVHNSGWPCREGPRYHNGFRALENIVCDELISAPDARSVLTDPWFYYLRQGAGAAVTGMAFVPENSYPEKYHGNLFFADYVLGNVWAMTLDAQGNPAPKPPEPVAFQVGIVDMDAAPDGYLYTVNIAQGTVDRLTDENSEPVAHIEASPRQGPAPLTVDLDASGSTQPGGGVLAFSWDLDDDGEFDDATGPTTSVTYSDEVNHRVHVEVTNEAGVSSVASETLYPGNTAPELNVQVSSPLPWTAGDQITFDATATDAEDGTIPAGDISWNAVLRHCYTAQDCHSHPHVGGTGTSGSFVGPSHGYPSYVELEVRATDSRGQSTVETLDLHPATAEISLTSSVPGASVTLGEVLVTTPATVTVILGDSVPVGVPNTQVIEGVTYEFEAWSDGAGASHQLDISGDLDLHLNLEPLEDG
ncbi:MAG: PQQ-dependent sugar dehydrogenase [Microthrixaceae bacterium]|nr:PQQ-dependent sugar dehydrogenase [Microthrixaceae bacterium]